MGRRLSKKLIEEALHKTKGAVYLAAKALGVSHSAVYNYINKYPCLQEVKDYYDNEMVDIAELGLRGAVEDEDPWAIKYLLSTKGKHRGYVERQELAGVKDAPLVMVNWDDNNNDTD